MKQQNVQLQLSVLHQISSGLSLPTRKERRIRGRRRIHPLNNHQQQQHFVSVVPSSMGPTHVQPQTADAVAVDDRVTRHVQYSAQPTRLSVAYVAMLGTMTSAARPRRRMGARVDPQATVVPLTTINIRTLEPRVVAIWDLQYLLPPRHHNL